MLICANACGPCMVVNSHQYDVRANNSTHLLVTTPDTRHPADTPNELPESSEARMSGPDTFSTQACAERHFQADVFTHHYQLHTVTQQEWKCPLGFSGLSCRLRYSVPKESIVYDVAHFNPIKGIITPCPLCEWGCLWEWGWLKPTQAGLMTDMSLRVDSS